MIGLGTSGWGEWARAGWGEAWNRRAPVKVPTERPPPPLLASIPEIVEAPWLRSQNVVALHLGLLGGPERNGPGFRQRRGRDALAGLTGATRPSA